jgi:hypothetical protein
MTARRTQTRHDDRRHLREIIRGAGDGATRSATNFGLSRLIEIKRTPDQER